MAEGKPVTRPIIFSAPMVRALLDGRKTMTRRLAWREPRDPTTHRIADSYQRPSLWQKTQVGDLLWVRETFAPKASGSYYFPSDTDGTVYHSWKSSIHMPRWASRLTLAVTAIKVEHLQAIDGIEALAEGIDREEGVAPWRIFMRLWNSIHGEGAWQLNPEVVAITFTVQRCNVDALSPPPASRG